MLETLPTGLGRGKHALRVRKGVKHAWQDKGGGNMPHRNAPEGKGGVNVSRRAKKSSLSESLQVVIALTEVDK